jgi:hypothetical protein
MQHGAMECSRRHRCRPSLRVVALGKSSRMAACFEEDSGSAKVSWKRAATVASDVVREERDADTEAGFHLLSITRLAWFFGLGSRYTDLAASRSLRRDTRFSSRGRDTWRRRGDWSSGCVSGCFRPAMNSHTVIFPRGGVDSVCSGL